MKKLLVIFLLFSLVQAEDKRFVIDICSYNNAQWFEKNLDSVLNQKYPKSHFRIIYTDDKSPDGTGNLVGKYLKDKDFYAQVLLIKNKERRRALANHYNAIHLCDDDEIILTLDGDDWLAHENVLSDLNDLYSNQDIWFAYSRFKNWPNKGRRSFGFEYSRSVPNAIINQNAYRRYTWVCGQLRTFYAWLAKSIKLEDLLLSKPLTADELSGKNFLGPIEKLTPSQLKRAHKSTNEFIGNFFPSACDVALMFPMLEMAGGKFAYIDEAIYIRNLATDINDHKADPAMQNYCARYIRAFDEYKPFVKPAVRCESQNDTFTTLIFVSGQVESGKNFDSPEKINQDNCVLMLSKNDKLDKQQLYKSLLNVGSYVFVTHSNFKQDKEIDFSKCIKHLQVTHAHAYYFNRPQDGVPCQSLLGKEVYFWQYAFGKPKPGMALYRKENVLKALNSDKVQTSLDLWQQLPKAGASLRSIGLFHTA